MDHAPPQIAGDERETLHVALTWLREGLVRKVEGVGEDDARRSPVPTGTNLLWLVKHVHAAEHIWLVQRFVGGQPGHLDQDLTEADTVASVCDAYRASWPELDAVILGHDLDTVVPHPRKPDEPLSLRWIVVHLIEEIARHAGHADLLRELIDGDAGR